MLEGLGPALVPTDLGLQDQRVFGSGGLHAEGAVGAGLDDPAFRVEPDRGSICQADRFIWLGLAEGHGGDRSRQHRAYEMDVPQGLPATAEQAASFTGPDALHTQGSDGLGRRDVHRDLDRPRVVPGPNMHGRAIRQSISLMRPEPRASSLAESDRHRVIGSSGAAMLPTRRGVTMATVCTWCGTDEYVDEHDAAEDIAWCCGPGHAQPRMFHPKREISERSKLEGWPGGIAYDLGLYDDLLALAVHDEWADTTVFEYRYAVNHPDTYRVMLGRWGHVTQGPRKYSTTSFIGSTLSQLSRMGYLDCRLGKGSGRFSYNSSMGLWALTPSAEGAAEVGWAVFARGEGIDPDEWPLA